MQITLRARPAHSQAPRQGKSESIPFTQTRDYVQAILRNEGIYRDLDKVPPEQK